MCQGGKEVEVKVNKLDDVQEMDCGEVSKMLQPLDDLSLRLSAYCHRCVDAGKAAIKGSECSKKEADAAWRCPISCGCNRDLDLNTAIAWRMAAVTRTFLRDVSDICEYANGKKDVPFVQLKFTDLKKEYALKEMIMLSDLVLRHCDKYPLLYGMSSKACRMVDGIRRTVLVDNMARSRW